MEALRYFPKGENKLDLIRVGGGVEFYDLSTAQSPDELVIQVYYAGLCGTDIHIVQVI